MSRSGECDAKLRVRDPSFCLEQRLLLQSEVLKGKIGQCPRFTGDLTNLDAPKTDVVEDVVHNNEDGRLPA
jgi:hypothetical protein